MRYFLLLLACCSLALYSNAQSSTIITGAACTASYLPLLKGKRVALLVNQTATIGPTHLVDSLLALHVNVVKILSPEHGFRGNADAGESVNNSSDEKTGLPIVSLYGGHHKATAADLSNVDILIFDIQDVGARFYTYISSLQELMEAAAENHKPLLVLDRPNPNGSYVDGPILDTAFRSFVGMQPIPIVHGMTTGEYAQLLNGEKWLAHHEQCELTVIPCLHYTHHTRYDIPIMPSPNLPNASATYLYPSLCLFEGTPISVGRGTDKPFQQFGSPLFPDAGYHFTPESRPGAKTPVLQNQRCYGFNLQGDAGEVYKKYGHQLQLQWLITAYQLYPDKATFFTPFFDKLAGGTQLRKQLVAGKTAAEIRASWAPGLARFKAIRKKYLLYAE
ncbi:DUF1343 domain-containing protein [Chitinophaga costaii]|nr:DUF1343 domain-containing protein [Chitinophaga costaii]PUZ24683.1 DUF1343 domain-containing protein [Chitinophaga costaii]